MNQNYDPMPQELSPLSLAYFPFIGLTSSFESVWTKHGKLLHAPYINSLAPLTNTHNNGSPNSTEIHGIALAWLMTAVSGKKHLGYKQDVNVLWKQRIACLYANK